MGLTGLTGLIGFLKVKYILICEVLNSLRQSTNHLFLTLSLADIVAFLNPRLEDIKLIFDQCARQVERER